MTSLQHTVTAEEANERIDLLMTKLTDYSRQRGQTLIKKGLVKVNGYKVKPSYRLVIDDEITWQMPEENNVIPRENIPLHIIHEDDDIIVINKEKGMITHPTPTIQKGTLVNALLNYTTELSMIGGEERPGIVHRLDKDTSGLLVIAKHDEAHKNLTEQFKARTVQRFYEAIVHGVIKHSSGVIKAPIGRDPKARHNMTVIETGRNAETHFKVINQSEKYTHVQCELKTGRTHQIRVHMNYIGHPLVGDAKYGYKDEFASHLLIAKKLAFYHPRTNNLVTYSVEYPTHFKKVLQQFTKTS